MAAVYHKVSFDTVYSLQELNKYSLQSLSVGLVKIQSFKYHVLFYEKD